MSNVKATLHEREQNYGNFIGHAYLSQKLKRTVKQHRGWNSLTPEMKEALDMILHKIARIINGNPNYVDSWHDIAGYATLIEGILQERALAELSRLGQEMYTVWDEPESAAAAV